MPEGHTFVIANSGVKAKKTGRALESYNRASRLAARLVEIWRESTGRRDPHLAAALHSSPNAPKQMAEIIAAKTAGESERTRLTARMDHFLRENGSIAPAAYALSQGNLDGFGSIADFSQEAAEQLLGNQVLETGFLAASARRREAVAATAFGAGFGGSVWALVETAHADRFLDEWRDSYTAKFPERADNSDFFITAPGHPMFRLC